MRPRQLPNLGALATFEVAAKHLSFTQAARELNLTQGAISQQMRQLEEALGTPLFIRKHNALELTSRGAELFEAVSAGLDLIGVGIGNLRQQTVPTGITISATDALASLWLKPLIDSFREAVPEARFTVLASDEDGAMKPGRAFWAGWQARRPRTISGRFMPRGASICARVRILSG